MRILVLGFLGMWSPPCPGTGQLCPSQVEMGAGYGQWGWGSLPLPASASTLPTWHPQILPPTHSRVSRGGYAAPALYPASPRGGFLLVSPSFTSSLEGCQDTQEWAVTTAIP